MTGDEFDHLRRRFGSDVDTWPAPYRQEAQLFLVEGGNASGRDSDTHLDRLVLEAALMETDEAALTRKVLARLNRKRWPAFLLHSLPLSWRLAATAAGVLAVIVAAGIGGFAVAGAGRLDDALLSFAIGDPGIIAEDLFSPFAQGLG